MNSQELVEKITRISGFTNHSGFKVKSVDEGRVVLEVEKNETLTQFNGFFHGGVISGLADHAAGAAATTALPEGQICVTVDLHVNFLAPADGEALIAEAVVVKKGSSLVVVTINMSTVKATEASICSIATATLKAVKLSTA